ncbi:hypothetical protein [Sphingomonas sp.]|uniref:hypothetical protein n=1 Tax=Sphingomonas sp. TaxID=28214 RepID=UPI003D6C8261
MSALQLGPAIRVAVSAKIEYPRSSVYIFDMDTGFAPKVLVIGVDPDMLDPDDWGVTAEQNAMVKRLIAEGEAALSAAGYAVEMVLIAIDAPLDDALAPRLKAEAWDCVVVGGGIRKPPELLDLFERVVNVVHRHAPTAAIAFNSRPDDTLDAVRRWIDAGDRDH